MIFVFDLDGTLVDTQEANRLAYLSAGIVMPPEAWGLPWTAWLNDPVAHKRKREVYPKYLTLHAQKLPLYDKVAEQKYAVITGASRECAVAVMNHFGMLNLQLTGATRDRKIEWLLKQDELGVYVDDDLKTRERVLRRTHWQVMSPTEALALSS